MSLQWLKDAIRSPKTMLWVLGSFVAVFLIVSAGVLLSGVTRGDVVALHNGFDAVTLESAEVGSFFEVYTDRVQGPLCADGFREPAEQISREDRVIYVVNRLGDTMPILTSLSDMLVEGGDMEVSTIQTSHVLQLSLEQTSVSTDVLWDYTRKMMAGTSLCRKAIDSLTRKNRDVRICPVRRVWTDGNGHVQALFFDRNAINGCVGIEDESCGVCPAYAAGQFWTRLKLNLGLLEDHGAAPPNSTAAHSAAVSDSRT